jgi:hypothetical protein
VFGGYVDAFFSHRLDGDGVDLDRGFRAGGADLDPAAREMVEVDRPALCTQTNSTDGLSDIGTP